MPPGRFRTNFWVRGAQKCPRNKKVQEIKRNLKKHYQGFTQSIRKYKKKIRQSKPSQMRSKVLDQTLAQKYDLKLKSFKLWWKNAQAFTQQQDIKKKETNHPCLLCCGPKVLVQYFSPKMSQIWPEKNFFKKIKNILQGFTQAITSVSNFRLNGPFMSSLEHPESFQSNYGPGLDPQGPKSKFSRNEKTTRDLPKL